MRILRLGPLPNRPRRRCSTIRASLSPTTSYRYGGRPDHLLHDREDLARRRGGDAGARCERREPASPRIVAGRAQASGAAPAGCSRAMRVALAHGVEARRRVGVEQSPVALDERDDLLAEIPCPVPTTGSRSGRRDGRGRRARCLGRSGAATRRSPRGGRACAGSPEAGGRRPRSGPRRPGGPRRKPDSEIVTIRGLGIDGGISA